MCKRVDNRGKEFFLVENKALIVDFGTPEHLYKSHNVDNPFFYNK